MNYVKVGFKLGLGLCFGKMLANIIGRATTELFRYYVPEKYWDRQHPENPLNQKESKSDRHGAETNKAKIGFSAD